MLLLFRPRTLLHGQAVARAAQEHRQLIRFLAEFLRNLHGRCTGADNGDFLAFGAEVFWPCTGMVDLTLVILQAGEVRSICTMKQTRGQHEIFSLGDVSSGSFDRPEVGLLIPRSVDDPRIEKSVLPQIQSLVDMSHVLSQFLVIREALVEVPVSVNFRDVELVERRLGINASTRIAVPVPA